MHYTLNPRQWLKNGPQPSERTMKASQNAAKVKQCSPQAANLPPPPPKLDGAHLIENNLLENIRKQEIFALFPGTTRHPAQPRLPQHATESFVVFGLGIW